MKITNNTRALVTQAMRDQEMNSATLSKKLGVDRSWTTRFFKTEGGMKTLSDDLRWKLQEILKIEFFSSIENKGASTLALKIDELMEKDEKLAHSFTLLTSALEDDHYFDIPNLPTKDLVDYGKEIVRASHENPDKPGKVGKLAIVWLAKRLERLEKDRK